MKTAAHHSALIGIVGIIVSLALPGVARGQATDVNVTNPASNPVNVQPVSDSQPFMLTTSNTGAFKNSELLSIPIEIPAGHYARIPIAPR